MADMKGDLAPNSPASSSFCAEPSAPKYVMPWVAEADTLQLMAGSLRNKHVLDVACRGGRSTRALSSLYPASIVAIDLSPQRIAAAKAAHQAVAATEQVQCPVHYIVHDFRNKFQPQAPTLHPVEFDVVTASYLLSHTPDLQTFTVFVENIFHVMRPGGVFIGLEDNP